MEVPAIIIDSASYLPIISLRFIRSHLTLSEEDIESVPTPSTDLRSAEGSPITFTGLNRFDLTLGDKNVCLSKRLS